MLSLCVVDMCLLLWLAKCKALAKLILGVPLRMLLFVVCAASHTMRGCKGCVCMLQFVCAYLQLLTGVCVTAHTILGCLCHFVCCCLLVRICERRA